MRLASFNVENLFARAKALNATAMGDVNFVLQAFDRFNTLVAKHEYKPEDKAALLEDLETLEVVVRTSGPSAQQEPVLGLGPAAREPWRLPHAAEEGRREDRRQGPKRLDRVGRTHHRARRRTRHPHDGPRDRRRGRRRPRRRRGREPTVARALQRRDAQRPLRPRHAHRRERQTGDRRRAPHRRRRGDDIGGVPRGRPRSRTAR